MIPKLDTALAWLWAPFLFAAVLGSAWRSARRWFC